LGADATRNLRSGGRVRMASPPAPMTDGEVIQVCNPATCSCRARWRGCGRPGMAGSRLAARRTRRIRVVPSDRPRPCPVRRGLRCRPSTPPSDGSLSRPGTRLGRPPDRDPGRSRLHRRPSVEAQTGYPVRSQYRASSGQDSRSLPHADPIVVAPATYTTTNKWARRDQRHLRPWPARRDHRARPAESGPALRQQRVGRRPGLRLVCGSYATPVSMCCWAPASGSLTCPAPATPHQHLPLARGPRRCRTARRSRPRMTSQRNNIGPTGRCRRMHYWVRELLVPPNVDQPATGRMG
jgi:hypothetical protein